MKLLRIEAHNLKRLSDIDLDLQGHHLFIVGGRNRAGKSSALDAVQYAICGKKSIPEKPLRTGEKSGSIRLTLQGHDEDTGQDGLIVEREFHEDGTTQLKLLSDDGFEAPQPQRLLDDLYDKSGFDPLAFTKLGPREQLDALRQIVGLDFTDLDRERQRSYDQRTLVNSQGKTLKARVDVMPQHTDAPEAPVNVADLMDLLSKVQKHNERNAKERRDVELLDSRVEEAARQVVAAREAVQAMERKLDAAKNAAQSYADAERDCRELADKHRAAISQLQDQDEAPIRQQITDADVQNRKLREVMQRRDVEVDVQALRDKSKSLSDTIEAIDAKKQEIMKVAKWPVEGLGFSGNGVTLNGLPFEQASSAEQLDVSIAMGMALNPKLKLMIIRDGSLLDDETMAVIEKRIVENNYQCIVEVVTRNAADEERCCVVIEEGKVKPKAVPA